jgi:hypothetical protein
VSGTARRQRLLLLIRPRSIISGRFQRGRACGGGVQQAFTRSFGLFVARFGVGLGGVRCRADRRRAADAVDGSGETRYAFGLAWRWFCLVFLVCSGFFRVFRFSAPAQHPSRYAPVAQWIEYCPPKAGVAGSIPAGRATELFCFSAACAF